LPVDQVLRSNAPPQVYSTIEVINSFLRIPLRSGDRARFATSGFNTLLGPA
jgi:hypothetical protein